MAVSVVGSHNSRPARSPLPSMSSKRVDVYRCLGVYHHCPIFLCLLQHYAADFGQVLVIPRRGVLNGSKFYILTIFCPGPERSSVYSTATCPGSPCSFTSSTHAMDPACLGWINSASMRDEDTFMCISTNAPCVMHLTVGQVCVYQPASNQPGQWGRGHFCKKKNQGQNWHQRE